MATEGATPYFFLSYARGGEDNLVRRFYEDLTAEVRLIAGVPPDTQVGFVDAASIRVGERWSVELTRALSTCRVFVALYSPRYFQSPACGREWQIFSERLHRYKKTGERRPESVPIMPVAWLPLRDVPEPVAELQYQPEGDRLYLATGLRQIMRLHRHSDAYREVVFNLARSIVDAAETFPLPELDERRIVFDTVENAFARTAPASGASSPGSATPFRKNAQAVVCEAFATAGRPLDPVGPRDLLMPGPVWISNEPEVAPEELEHFGDHVAPGRIGYLVHAHDLRHDTATTLDRMRLDGKPIVTIPIRALRAALADGRSRLFLNELDRCYGSKDNLFDTKNALTDERFLFGRDTMLNTVGSAIKRDEHVLITGLRKVGKTSLLNVLRQYLVDQPVCVVDLQRFDRHLEDWPSALFRLMIEAFDRWGHAERVQWPFTPSAPATVTELERELHRRIDHLGTATRLTVILDELERVFPGPGETDAARRWIRASGALRVLAQGDRRSVVVIGADLRPVANRENQLDSAGTNPFFSFFHEIPLPLLDQRAVTSMVRTLASEMGVENVEPGFIERLFALTGGHPSLARTVAGEAYRQRRDSTALTETDLGLGLDRLDETDSVGYFLRNNLWQLMTPTERRVICDTADVSGAACGVPILQHHHQHRGQATAALRSQGLIAGDQIRIGLFERWLREQAGTP